MDSIAVVKNNVKYASWISMVNACQSSGMPIKTWCRVNNIGIKTYYYRLHRVREMYIEQNRDMVTQEIAKLPVVPISEPVTNSVTIHCENITIDIPQGIDENTITSILRAVKTAW